MRAKRAIAQTVKVFNDESLSPTTRRPCIPWILGFRFAPPQTLCCRRAPRAKHPSLLSYTSPLNGGFHKKFRGSRPKLSKLTGLADLNNGENQIRPANIFLGQGWLRIRRRESNQPAGSGPVTGQQPTPERVAARAYSEEPGDRSLTSAPPRTLTF